MLHHGDRWAPVADEGQETRILSTDATSVVFKERDYKAEPNGARYWQDQKAQGGPARLDPTKHASTMVGVIVAGGLTACCRPVVRGWSEERLRRPESQP